MIFQAWAKTKKGKNTEFIHNKKENLQSRFEFMFDNDSRFNQKEDNIILGKENDNIHSLEELNVYEDTNF